MNVLVTGGAGFIGSHLVDHLLKDGHEVTVIDISSDNIGRNLNLHDNLRFICDDVNNINTLDIGDIDAVVHLAALADIVPSIEEPLKYHHANVDGTVAVLEFARKNNVKKFIYAGSGSCYGDKPKVPTQETDPIDCKYPYALTKWIGEQYVFHWHKVYGIPVISLRFFNVYGPRSRTTGAYGAVFGVFLAQKIKGKPFTVVGNGSQSRDFIYVSDVARAIILAIHSDKKGEVYNIGSGTHVSINSLVNLLRTTNGIERNVVNLPERPGEPQITMAWTDKAATQLNFRPQIDFKRGVGIMLDNIDYWKDAPVWDEASIKDATSKWFETMGENNANKI